MPSFSLDDNAVPTVIFDMDQDPNTIPEYTFVYCIYSGKLGAYIFGGTHIVRDATHLITMEGNKMYLSVPLAFLGNGDGAMNINAETALPDKFNRTIYDRARDAGFISIGGNGL